jgi:ribosomal protein L20
LDRKILATMAAEDLPSFQKLTALAREHDAVKA